MTSLLCCAPNFRDLGGTPARDGRSVKPGLLYRSETLIGPCEDDQHWLTHTGAVGCVVDLRTDLERSQQGGYWLTQDRVPVRHFPMQTDVRAAEGDAWQTRLAEMDVAAAHRRSLETYGHMPTAFSPRLAEVFALLDNADAPPLLIHCVLGKDRTGFMIAMILAALDVEWEVILEDYLSTAKRLPPKTVAARKISQLMEASKPIPAAEVLEILCGVSPEWLTAAFDMAAKQHGTLNNYLAASGADATLRKRLQARMLA
jgi:protein-tyrosine phosphatase